MGLKQLWWTRPEKNFYDFTILYMFVLLVQNHIKQKKV